MTLGGRDEQRLREVIRREDSRLPRQHDRARLRPYPIPTLARATAAVGSLQLGTFQLQKNTPRELEAGTDTRSAYALCPISNDQLVLLSRCTGEESGGFWVAQPCTDAPPEETFPCAAWSGGEIQQQSLKISDLVDTTENEFDGWADLVNGQYELNHESVIVGQNPDSSTSYSTSECNPGLTINVPRSTTEPFAPSGPFGVVLEATIVPNQVSLRFFAGSVFELQLGTLRAIGVGVHAPETAGGFTRDAQNRPDSSSSYIGWNLQSPDPASRSLNFYNWLSNGTFLLNP